MSKYADIIKDLAAATEASRELEKRVLDLLGFHSWAGRVSYRDGPRTVDFGSSEITASLDAAIGLVERMLPGCEYTFRKHVSEGFNASVNFVGSNRSWIFSGSDSNCANLAIALLLALFRALEAQEVQP